MLNNEKICLVTGASGFIGLRLCAALQKAGWKVLAISRRISDGPWDQSFRTDLLDKLPGEAFTNTEVVYHLAGKAHALAETRAEEKEYNVNVEGTRNLLNKAKDAGVRRFVFFSSIKAMGDGRGSCLAEGSQCYPDTPYGRSKLAVEQLVMHGVFVPESVVLRLSMVYGPNQKGNLQRMINAVAKGSFPSIPEVGNKRSMIHVDDVVQAAILAGTHPGAAGETYIVTDGQAYSTRRMYEWICKSLHKQMPRWTIPLGVLRILAKTGDGIGLVRGRRFVFDSAVLDKLIGSAWYSSEKIQRELGFKPTHNLQDSLPEIIAGMKE